MDRVIFRKFKKDNEVIAFFPDIRHHGYGTILSYMHIGQHSDADYYGLLADTVPATQDDYIDLYTELICIGYEPRIVKRLIRT